MSSNLVGLLNRIHAVNTEIATVNSNLTLTPKRYYPNLQGLEGMPYIAPIVPTGEHDNTEFGNTELHSVWSIPILLFVDNFLAGSAPSDAQANCEACIDHVLTEYFRRPRLDLAETVTTDASTESAGLFNCMVKDSRLRRNTTIEIANNSVAIVRFTFEAETTNYIERI